MKALQSRVGIEYNHLRSQREPKPLSKEIESYLNPREPESEKRIAKIAREKLESGVSADLTTRVSEAVESAIFQEFHKGIDNQIRGYWT